jgi:hypothetical protein
MQTSSSLNNQQSLKCESTGKQSYSLPAPLLQWLQSVACTYRQVLHAIRGFHVGNSLRVAYQEILTNNRVFIGGVFMFGVAPLFYMAHLFLDQNVVLEGFYYRAPYYWFFTNREEFGISFVLTGFFLIAPTRWGFRYLLIPFIAACITEIVYQSFFIDSWDFYTTPSWEVYAVIVASLFPLYKVINYMCYLKYHVKDGNVSRIIGVIKAPNVSLEQKMKILEDLANEYENFYSRI